jgi:hypothetical protein
MKAGELERWSAIAGAIAAVLFLLSVLKRGE